MGRFTGRRALVTGAASGIGRATARLLAHEGATVACLDVDADGLTATVAGLGDGAVPLVCDLLDRAAGPGAVDRAARLLGGLDTVCTVAGVGGFRLDEDQTLDDWDRILGVNLTGTWLVCQAALPHLRRDGGAIVTTASTAGTDATPYHSAYSASKGGVIALTRSLAITHHREGIRANCVAPGPIDTPITAQYGLPEGADPAIVATILPFGAPGLPGEVAATIAFLASDDASHVNGVVLKVDGGKTA
jgi:NAD(P)-dependent dehydrogenase (short-subunit alcohol dehydrogenase family)